MFPAIESELKLQKLGIGKEWEQGSLQTPAIYQFFKFTYLTYSKTNQQHF